MPIRHGGRLASRASTWPRDHFWRSTSAPRRSWPTMWNEFLPISMPITAILLLSFSDMACSFVFDAPCQLGLMAGLEHGRTIPFSDIGPSPTVTRRALMNWAEFPISEAFLAGERVERRLAAVLAADVAGYSRL